MSRWVRALSLAIWASGVWGIAAAAEDAEGKWRYQVPRGTGQVEVDGRLDEPIWKNALEVALDYEIRPGENTAPPARTQMLVTHDDRFLYVGFRAEDPDPSKIRARIADRDAAFDDDIVGITIDTFNDGRRALEFWANPLGVQMDLVYDDVNDNEDDSWNAIWYSEGRLREGGYDVEMAIPFYSLSFPKSSGEQTWGFDGIRFYPREHDYSFRSQPRDRNRSCYICQFSKMTGFAGADPGRNLELTPTLTGGRNDRRSLGQNVFEEGDFEEDFGLTVKWGMTPSLTLNATVNPDFSQIEADVAQLEVNNPFALFFPETRPFFIEGADLLETTLDVVHTRVVADPDWGLKMTGKQGRHALAVFAAQDTTTNLLIPGSQTSRFTSINDNNLSTVLRYRRDIGEGSNLGMILTDREGDDYFNRVAGVDGRFRFTESDTISFQALGSDTGYPDEVVRELGQPEELDDLAYRVSFEHDSRNWFGYFRYEDIGEDFRADLGFLPQVDKTFLLGGFERRWWGEKEDWWTRMWMGADWDLTHDQSGQELERELEGWFSIAGPKQSFAELHYGQRTRFFGGREFEESFRNFYFEVRPSGALYFEVSARSGDQIDFTNVRPGKQLQIVPALRADIGRHLKIRFDHTFDKLDVEGGELFRAHLSELRLIYQINKRTLVRLISQFFDIERDPDLFASDVEATQQDLFNQLLFSYKLNPRTVVFVGYSDSYGSDLANDLMQTNRTVFMKLSYAWVL